MPSSQEEGIVAATLEDIEKGIRLFQVLKSRIGSAEHVEERINRLITDIQKNPDENKLDNSVRIEDLKDVVFACKCVKKSCYPLTDDLMEACENMEKWINTRIGTVSNDFFGGDEESELKGVKKVISNIIKTKTFSVEDIEKIKNCTKWKPMAIAFTGLACALMLAALPLLIVGLPAIGIALMAYSATSALCAFLVGSSKTKLKEDLKTFGAQLETHKNEIDKLMTTAKAKPGDPAAQQANKSNDIAKKQAEAIINMKPSINMKPR